MRGAVVSELVKASRARPSLSQYRAAPLASAATVLEVLLELLECSVVHATVVCGNSKAITEPSQNKRLACIPYYCTNMLSMSVSCHINTARSNHSTSFPQALDQCTLCIRRDLDTGFC